MVFLYYILMILRKSIFYRHQFVFLSSIFLFVANYIEAPRREMNREKSIHLHSFALVHFVLFLPARLVVILDPHSFATFPASELTSSINFAAIRKLSDIVRKRGSRPQATNNGFLASAQRFVNYQSIFRPRKLANCLVRPRKSISARSPRLYLDPRRCANPRNRCMMPSRGTIIMRSNTVSQFYRS